MSVKKKWIVNEVDSQLISNISEKFNISKILAKAIVNRGYTDDDSIAEYINTNKSQFHNPFLLKGMDVAVNLINSYVKDGKKIAVYGDYDVDGITSTYILYDYLKSVGANVIYYIPDRATEGYGLNTTAIDSLKNEDTEMIVTVDVGITAISEVEYAKENGMEIIITDHHTPMDILPEASAVINPKICPEYPFSELAGVGVAFKLVYALSGCDDDVIEKYSGIACIGTIADMVPLKGENRFIASHGLKKLSESDNYGLNALIEVCGIDKKQITSSNIGYGLAPRMNAAGRIASASTSVELLLAEDKIEAMEIALMLDEGNKARQTEEQKIFDEAIEIIERDKLYLDNVIIVAKKDWHHGIIGIVSSKITEKYYKPSAVLSIGDDGCVKASGRSIKGFNIFDALSECSEHLLKFGGHELAAGFSLKSEDIDTFRSKINQYSESIITEEILTPKLTIDSEILISDINHGLIEELKILEPYGIGNKSPIFSIENVNVKSIRVSQSGKHAFVGYEKGKNHGDSPAFNLVEKASGYSSGDVISIAGNLNINSFRGVDSPQFIVKDIRPGEKSEYKIDNLRRVFLCIKNYVEREKYTFSLTELSNDLKKSGICSFGSVRLKNILKIFDETNLIKARFSNESVSILKGENFSGKCDIENSPTFISVQTL